MKEKIQTKLKKEDTVTIIAGKDKGKTGKIVKIDREAGRVIIEGLNMVKKAKKPKNQQDKGGIVDIEAPIDTSNVMIVCKKCGPTRIGFNVSGDVKKRICRKCGEAL
jgi:large subunit ribosomal protein L24